MFKLVVLSCLLAVASTTVVAPLGLAGTGQAGWAGQGLAAPYVTSPAAPAVVAAPAIGAYNYRGPLSLAPGQPANILAADGRPLDTISVNLDRAAHYTARAVDGARVLRKRSVVLAAAPVAWSHTAGLAVPATLAAPLAAGQLAAGQLATGQLAAGPLIAGPFAAGPLTAATLVGAWGQGPWSQSAAWGASRG